MHCRSTFKWASRSRYLKHAIDSRMIDAVAVILPLHAHNLSVGYSSYKYTSLEVPLARLFDNITAPSATAEKQLLIRLPKAVSRLSEQYDINPGVSIIGIDRNETKLSKNPDRQFAARKAQTASATRRDATKGEMKRRTRSRALIVCIMQMRGSGHSARMQIVIDEVRVECRGPEIRIEICDGSASRSRYYTTRCWYSRTRLAVSAVYVLLSSPSSSRINWRTRLFSVLCDDRSYVCDRRAPCDITCDFKWGLAWCVWTDRGASIISKLQLLKPRVAREYWWRTNINAESVSYRLRKMADKLQRSFERILQIWQC